MKKAVKNAFVKADHAFADASSLDSSSGTTALTALILGRWRTLLLLVPFYIYFQFSVALSFSGAD